MDERLFATLAGWLADGPVVVASVLDTRGATPRKRGSRMLVAAGRTAFSVGGGAAEARVVEAAQALLGDARTAAEVDIALDGQPGAAGVCGGRMHIALRRWCGGDDLARAGAIAARLASGETETLAVAELGHAPDHALGRHARALQPQVLQPDPRLLIVGAGHCGLALHQMARLLDFDTWVHDERPGCFADNQFHGATVLRGGPELLARSADTGRTRLVVLLTRDFRRDVAALDVLLRDPPAFLGMMGSRRRIAEVRAALPQHAAALDRVVAPVGLEIGAQTPHEIAVSILAQLIQYQGAHPAGLPAPVGADLVRDSSDTI